MKKLLLAVLLFVGCKGEAPENKSINFIRFVNPEATCVSITDETAVCKIPMKDAASLVVFCHAFGQNRPECEEYGRPPPKAEATPELPHK